MIENILSSSSRNEALKSVFRFQGANMLYQTDLYVHSKRVFHIVNFLKKSLDGNYGLNSVNIDILGLMALIHDDLEPFHKMGDVPTHIKRNMSGQQRAEYDLENHKALLRVEKKFGNIFGMDYITILKRVEEKKCLESQLVSYADKIDGFGEALHELSAGNEEFLDPVKRYKQIFENLQNELYFLSDFLKSNHLYNFTSTFYLNQLNPSGIMKKGKIHTKESINRYSGIALYEFWKYISKEHGLENVLLENPNLQIA